MREIPAWFGLTAVEDASRELVILGCPVEEPGSFRGGTAAAPGAIREWAKTADAVTEDGNLVQGLRVVDRGDAEVDEDPRASLHQAAAAAWSAYPGGFHLALGGDHGVTPALVEAATEARGDMAFVILDAHPDAFDSYDGRADTHATVLPRIWERAGIDPAATAVVGVRSVSIDERPALDRTGLVVTSRQWSAWGSSAVAAALRPVIGDRPVYLSLDIDVLDPSCAPGVAYPIAGGVGSRELLEMLDLIWNKHDVAAMDLVEVIPALDPSGVTAATAAHLLLQVFGHVARGG